MVTRTTVAGITSTGSKRPDALFGADYDGPPLRMVRSAGSRVWDDAGVEYLDFVMALGAVTGGEVRVIVAGPDATVVANDIVGLLERPDTDE